MHRGSAWPKSLSERPRTSHLEVLLEERAKSMGKLSTVDDVEAAEGGVKVQGNKPIQSKQSMEMQSEFVQKLEAALSKDNVESTMPPMEIRLQNVSYQVPTHDDPKDGNKIATVYNTSALYKIRKFTEWILEAEDPHASLQKKDTSVTNVLSNVNLVLQPQKMYLVLGPPLSGKTSLLKAIAGMLPQGEFPKAQWTEISKTFHKGHKDGKTAEETPENKFFTGQVLYNNLVCSGEGADESRQNLFRNLVAFVRQNDAHAPRFTVGETFTFAGNCKHPGVKTMNRELDDEGRVGLTLRGLGLNHVKDTFVGNDVIRGVSGGQRRRATLGEVRFYMLLVIMCIYAVLSCISCIICNSTIVANVSLFCSLYSPLIQMLTFDTPLLCGDEISTGLDTASTVDILRILSYLGRLLNRVSVVSLLQPSPEAVSLFDEIILLGAGGHVIFAGPTGDAVDYFKGLGYAQPDAMDDADYLLAVASSDRKHLFQRGAAKVEEGELPTEEVAKEPHTPKSFSEVFAQSKDGVKIAECQQKEWKYDWSGGKIEAPPGAKFDVKSFENKYQNSFLGSVWLNLKRSFILWTRDMTYIRASAIKNVGGVTKFAFDEYYNAYPFYSLTTAYLHSCLFVTDRNGIVSWGGKYNLLEVFTIIGKIH